MTVQQFFAALVFAVCLAMLVYHGLGARRQAAVQRWWQRHAARARQAWTRWRAPKRRRSDVRNAGLRRHDRAAERATDRAAGRASEHAAGGATDSLGHAEDAEREAADLIERARRRAHGDGKVIRPRFGDRRRDLH